MQYKIEQYPKNKDFDVSKLNEYQIFIRNNRKYINTKRLKYAVSALKNYRLKNFM